MKLLLLAITIVAASATLRGGNDDKDAPKVLQAASGAPKPATGYCTDTTREATDERTKNCAAGKATVRALELVA